MKRSLVLASVSLNIDVRKKKPVVSVIGRAKVHNT